MKRLQGDGYNGIMQKHVGYEANPAPNGISSDTTSPSREFTRLLIILIGFIASQLMEEVF